MRKYLLLFLLLVTPLAARELNRSPDSVVENWLIGSHLGRSAQYRNLVLYPVVLPARGLPDYLTLDQALALKSLKIGEMSDSGSVNELSLRNQGAQPVFIMAGEILEGAKQDRVLQDDLWLPANSGSITAACFCVEHGRWSSDTTTFEKSRPVTANPSVRAEARATRDQGAVWSSVEKAQKSAGYSDSTNLGKTYDDPAVKARLEGYREALGAFARDNPEARGVVVQVGDQMLVADLFADRAGFVLKFSKLIPSYALEAANQGGSSATPNSDRALSFLRRVAGGAWTTKATPGEGKLLSFSGADGSGSALVLDQVVVHLEAFPKGKITTERPTVPIQRQYPR